MTAVRGILMDYGGTIDTGGLHWGTVLCRAWEKYIPGLRPTEFFYPYVQAERQVAGLVSPSTTFEETLRLKTELQGRLLLNDHAPQVADSCYRFARMAVDDARPWLERLAARYQIMLVSNFYGNLETVVSEMGLDGIFAGIVDSAYVGIRKPDAAIWQLGADALGMSPAETVAVGDSEKNDILPARAIGCRTARVIAEGIRSETEADMSGTLRQVAERLL